MSIASMPKALWVLALVTLLLGAYGGRDSVPASSQGLQATNSMDSPSRSVRDVSGYDLFSGDPGQSMAFMPGPEPTLEEVLADGLRLAGASPVHIAFRGSGDGNSVQCHWRGIARTAEQREDAIRFWLGLEENDAVPTASQVEALFTVTLDVLDPLYRETAKSNFNAIATGGLSEGYLFLTCYAHYAVQEYLLGPETVSAGTQVTVGYDRMGESYSYDLYRLEHDSGHFGNGPRLSRGEHESSMLEIVTAAEGELRARIGDRESVVFLAPMGAHNAIAVEAWQAVAQWDLQEDEEGVVHAVRYGAPVGDPEYTQTLSNLESRITTAAASDEFAGERIESPEELDDYYREIGAYGDITPDDGSTETFTPAQPPPAMSCANGTAVTDPSTIRGLVHDCQELLDASDTLRGTADLDWSADSVITDWEGVSIGGTPSRVTRVELASGGLSGSIPAGLGRLFELTHLDLSSNSLTGEIPRELGWLYNLESLKLSGNSLTGCIPVALEGVASNDLSSLNLLYCRPPAPEGLAGTATKTGMALSWNAVSNTSKYRMEYRLRGPDDWTLASDTLTVTSHTLSDLSCGSAYQFRVGAYGSGTAYAAEWSDGSAVLNMDTLECTDPVFDEEYYSFNVVLGTAVGATVGTVTAVDPNGDAVSYSIVGGNEAGKFGIDGSTGEITVAGSLGDVTVEAYTLEVQASDGVNTGSTTVEVVLRQPTVTLSGVPDAMVVRDLEYFTVRVEDMAPSLSYRIRVEADGEGIAFHRNRCSYLAQDSAIATGRTSYVKSYALHACDTPGGTVTATLLRDDATVDTATWDVTISEPATPRLPSIEILGLPSTIEKGQGANFRVRAFYMDLAEPHSIRLSTDGANTGFDEACADRQRDIAVTLGNAWEIVSLNLYGCDAPGGVVTAVLLLGYATVATATWEVTVLPGPSIGITGLAETMAVGQRDDFEVALSHLTGGSVFMEVATEGGNLGFDSGCTDLLEEPEVPSGPASHAVSLTLHACATAGGTVTATLSRRGRRSPLTRRRQGEAIAAPYPAISVRSSGNAPRGMAENDRRKTVTMTAQLWMQDVQSVATRALEAARAGAKVLVVRNTVGYAIATQQALEEIASVAERALLFSCEATLTLHHGRFAPADRRLLDHEVERRLGRDRSPWGMVVVGTQTLEQSLDIDADLLITDLCPVDVLLQRIGRMHRHPRDHRPQGYSDPRCVVLMPDAEDLTSFLRSGPDRNGLGPHGYVYEDLRVLESTRRLVRESSTWEIPKMNRELVERATHPVPLKRIVEELGEDWLVHANKVTGDELADGLTASQAIIRRDKSFFTDNREVLFPTSMEEKIRTRLGDDRLDVELEPAPPSPFEAGRTIKRLALPLRWVDPSQIRGPATPSLTDDGFTFSIGDRVFCYDRLGLRRL